MFVKNFSQNNKAKGSDLIKNCAKAWKELTEIQKEDWNNKAKDLNDKQIKENDNMEKKHIPFDEKDLMNSDLFCNMSHVENHLDDRQTVIIDARSQARFNGTEEEPREGLQRGHIPNSFSTPYNEFLNNDGTIKSSKEIRNVFKNAGLKTFSKKKNYIFTCGSGVTACIPFVAATAVLGVPIENCKIYDGSFSEWGLLENNKPVDVL